jgi:hypothetical protein
MIINTPRADIEVRVEAAFSPAVNHENFKKYSGP